MNFYQHHIGDYLTKTAHLTLIEHGAYRRLLDVYYSTERMLPLDIKAIYRLIMARSKDEQAAVDTVLSEFFDATENGYRQTRCDREIGLCNKNRDNGKKGGRPSAHRNPEETQTEPRLNPEETQTEPKGKGPNTQYPIPNKKQKNITPSADADDEKFNPASILKTMGVSDSVISDWLAMRKHKRANATKTAISGIEREAIKSGWDMQSVLAYCCERGWTGFKADWVKGEAAPSCKQPAADGKPYRDPLIYGFDVANGDPLPDGWKLPPTGATRYMAGIGWVLSSPKPKDKPLRVVA